MMSFSIWLKLTARMIGRTVASAGIAGFITASAIASSHFVAQHHLPTGLTAASARLSMPCPVTTVRLALSSISFPHARTVATITAGDHSEWRLPIPVDSAIYGVPFGETLAYKPLLA